MDLTHIATPGTLPAGTWFLFSENGESKLALSAVYEVSNKTQQQHCIVVAPGTPTIRPVRLTPNYGAFPLPEARAMPPANATAFHTGYDGEYEPGSLIVTPSNWGLAFAFREGGTGIVDLQSGRLVDQDMRPPFGWFSEWRLFQKGPNNFEEVFRFVKAPSSPISAT
jgi:hypothetical protein